MSLETIEMAVNLLRKRIEKLEDNAQTQVTLMNYNIPSGGNAVLKIGHRAVFIERRGGLWIFDTQDGNAQQSFSGCYTLKEAIEEYIEQ